MTRYIDADALKFYGNHIGDEYEDRFHDKQWVHLDEIDNAPTIDAVEVVRCKDCKHRTELPYVDKDTHEPIYDCGYNISAIWGEENGYCNHGERRE